jgi:hypothetical protein
MDFLQKPQSALKKYISKVSIRTVIRSTEDAEDAEPLNRSRTTHELVSRPMDVRDPRVCPPLPIPAIISRLLHMYWEMLTGAELASLEERRRLPVLGPVNCCRRDLENIVRHDEQHHRDAV